MEKRVRELEMDFATTDVRLADILARLSRIEVGIMGLVGLALVSSISAIWYLATHNVHIVLSSPLAGG